MPYLAKLSSDQIIQHVEQSHTLWGGKKTIDDRVKLILKRAQDYNSFHYMSGVVDNQGNLNASLKRYYYPVMLMGRKYNCLGLGAVFTDPQFRKQGMAKQMIEATIVDAQADIMMLYSDIGTEYYSKFGFQKLSTENWSLNIEKEIDNANSFKEIEKNDMDYILKWQKINFKDASIYHLRDERTRPLFLDLNGVAEEIVIYKNNTKIGYAAISFNENSKTCWLEDFLYNDDEKVYFCQQIMGLAKSKGAIKLSGWYSSSLPFGDVEREERKNAITMVKFLNKAINQRDIELHSAHFQSIDHY
jgi:predicted acetyltransferase